MRRVLATGVLALAALSAGGAVAEAAVPAASAPGAVPTATRCSDTVAPGWFTADAKKVAAADSGIPDSWGADHNFARIVCFESSYRTSAANGIYHGLGQMSETSVEGTHVSWNSYLHGTSAHPVSYYQILAALRYCKARYGSPSAGWSHEVNYGWW